MKRFLLIVAVLAVGCGDVAEESDRVAFVCDGITCTAELGGASASTVGVWQCPTAVKAVFDTSVQSDVQAFNRDGFAFESLERITITRVEEADGTLCPFAPMLEVVR